jgi:hypothetical protein
MHRVLTMTPSNSTSWKGRRRAAVCARPPCSAARCRSVRMFNMRQEAQCQPGLHATAPGRAARQAAYPHPATERERALHELLGAVNEAVTGRAVAAMQRGDVAALGARVPPRG